MQGLTFEETTSGQHALPASVFLAHAHTRHLGTLWLRAVPAANPACLTPCWLDVLGKRGVSCPLFYANERGGDKRFRLRKSVSSANEVGSSLVKLCVVQIRQLDTY